MHFRYRPIVIFATVLLLTLLVSQPFPASAQEINPYQFVRFDRITPADGLSFPFVQAIQQDSQGYMWFATAGGGLNRYDGYTFSHYRKNASDPSSIPFDDVRTLFVDSDDQLWIGGSAGLARYDRPSDSFQQFDNRGQVFAIAEDNHGTLWAGFWHGLYGYDRTTGALTHTFQYDPNQPDNPDQISQGYVYALVVDHAGDLWIGTDNGLDRLEVDCEIFHHFQNEPGNSASLSHNVVLTIYEDSQDRLWAGTPAGLNLLDRSSGEFVRFQHDPKNDNTLAANTVTRLIEDNQHNLWIATNRGLDQLLLGEEESNPRALAIDEVHFIHHKHDPLNPHTLSDDVVSDLYQDRSGLVWVATTNGLSKVNRRSTLFKRYQHVLESYGATPSFPEHADIYPMLDDVILAFAEDDQGNIWIAGNTTGLYQLNPRTGEIVVYRHDPTDPTSLSADGIHAVFVDKAGDLWLGLANGWLERFDRQTNSFIHERQLTGTSIVEITEDGLGNLWLGTSGNGLYRLDADRVTLVHYQHYWQQGDHWKLYGSLSSHIIEALFIDRNEQLWIGTYAGGINLWDKDHDRFDHYRHDPGDPLSLGHDRVLAFGESAGNQEIVWVGTMGGGLNRFDRETGKFTRYTQADGLPGDSVNCILPDGNGYLWLSTVQGLARFDPSQESYLIFDQEDGLPGIAISCFQSSSGELYFGTTNGFFTIHPDRIPMNSQPPPILITNFKAGNQPVKADLFKDEVVELSHQENSVSFEFAALDFTNPDKNQYAYQMIGQGQDWVNAGQRHVVEYTNLPPGDYIFRVKGSNNNGIWNEDGAAVAFIISPPYWQTWWFRGLVFFILLGALIGGYRLRVRNLEQRSRQLAEDVESRTVELLAANQLLEQEIEERARAEEELAQQRAAAAVVAERGRLARELHDAVTQTLFSASLIAEIVPQVWDKDPAAGRRQLEEVRTLTRGALAEMRTLLMELRPEAITKSDMSDLLDQLGRATTGRCGTPVAVTASKGEKILAEVQLAFYRIAQEALNNAAKHAEASQILVEFKYEPGKASMVVEDDGRGFDIGYAPADHFGLQIMKERAGAIGASLSIHSHLGSGTRIAVHWMEETAPEDALPADDLMDHHDPIS